jgi:hypothetical protein
LGHDWLHDTKNWGHLALIARREVGTRGALGNSLLELGSRHQGASPVNGCGASLSLSRSTVARDSRTLEELVIDSGISLWTAVHATLVPVDHRKAPKSWGVAPTALTVQIPRALGVTQKDLDITGTGLAALQSRESRSSSRSTIVGHEGHQVPGMLTRHGEGGGVRHQGVVQVT